ncbi:MAG: 50S ribosomal protein L1 [Candidatus Marsarchaeota archaeon]|nr:50S ribosomal protein L1 [Candidatus Marsarchaeota archaeon]
MEQEQLDKLKALLEENKGKRKFKQSVELAVNFKGVDFSKQENRLNLQVLLPNGKGKTSEVLVFADDKNISDKAKELGARVVSGAEIQQIASDKAQLNSLLKYEMIAQPSLMTQVARGMGSFLGPKNKMPKPLIGTDVSSMINSVSKSVYLRSKGKYLPTVHCMVGKEDMPIDKISANIDEVLNSLAKKLGKQNIKSAYVKLTMSKPVKLI